MSSHFLLQTDEISPPPPYPKGLESNPSTHYLKNDPMLDSTVKLQFLREGLMGRCHGHAESDVRTKKNKEVCTAQVDRSGESFRVPGVCTYARFPIVSTLNLDRNPAVVSRALAQQSPCTRTYAPTQNTTSQTFD